MIGEAERIATEFADSSFDLTPRAYNVLQLAPRIPRYETILVPLLTMVVAGGYWGEEIHSGLWTQVLERIIRASENPSVASALAQLAMHPVRLLFFGCGIAACASERHSTVAALLTKGHTLEGGREKSIWSRLANPDNHSHLGDVLRTFPEESREKMPVSNRISRVLRPYFSTYLPSDHEFARIRDRFEYLSVLSYAHDKTKEGVTDVIYPVGLFMRAWRTLFDEIDAEAGKLGQDWPLLSAGAFDGEIEAFFITKQKFDEWARKAAPHFWFGF